MPVGIRHAREGSGFSALQILMCQMGADPPGFFAPTPRQPIQHAVQDPSLPAAVRILEFVRFHTVCYEGVPKNAQGEAQFSPFCVGVDGKRLNQRDCARETGLSTSVVKRTFDSIRGAGYTAIKNDGSIWYCGKVAPRGAAVRLSVSECLQERQHRPGDAGQRVLQTLVTGRVMAASLVKAAKAFPPDDQTAVEAHMLEVARWQRAEIAHRIALVREEAEHYYQVPSWHGYRLGKVGHTWVRVPAQDSLFATPRDVGSVSPDRATCIPDTVCASSSVLAVSGDQTPDQKDGARTPETAALGIVGGSFACAHGLNNGGSTQGRAASAPPNKRSFSAHCRTRTVQEAAAKPIPAGAVAKLPEGIAAAQNTSAISPNLRSCVPENSFVSSSPIAPKTRLSPGEESRHVPETAPSASGEESCVGTNCVNCGESREAKPQVAAPNVSGAPFVSGSCAATTVLEAAAEPMPASAALAYAESIRRVFAGTGKGVPTDGQLGCALTYLPKDATPPGFARFIRGKLSAIRHAGALVRLAQEYAHELRYQPQAAVFQCVKCHDQGFVLPGGQYCECGVGIRRRQAEEPAHRAGP